MNEHNLIPGGYNLTVEEQSSGGRKSGETRRKKRDMKQCMELLLSLPATQEADYKLLADMGVYFDYDTLSPDDINNMIVVNAALLKLAKMGDVAAIKELRNIIRDDAYLKQKIKHENEKIKLEKERQNKSDNGSDGKLRALIEGLKDDLHE